jgi:hypothetical protein
MTPAWFPSAMILAAIIKRSGAPTVPAPSAATRLPRSAARHGGGSDSNARLPRADREAADPPDLIRGV